MLLLSCTPGEWEGAFALAAEALVRDVLSDGPVEVLVNGEARLRTLSGYLDGTLIFNDNSTESLLDLTSITVP